MASETMMARLGAARARPVIACLVLALAFTAACGSAQSEPPTELKSLEDQLPSFVELGELQVTVGDQRVRLGDSTLKYHRRSVGSFDDPATVYHDGIDRLAQRFLACETDDWRIGHQNFTADVIADGIDQRNPTLIEYGAIGLDWGVNRSLGRDGVHSLHRECDGQTIEDSGGTHGATRWLAAMGRAVYLLRSVENGEYEDRIDRYTERIEELAERLADPQNTEYWKEHWLVDKDGNIFTHKTFMRAAGLQLAASLTDDYDKAATWVKEAETIARRGIAAQHDDGVLPERGGYDVSYQMHSVWHAQLYLSVLSEESPVHSQIEELIDRGIAWMVRRTDPETGKVDIGDSTRTCTGAGRADTADQVRVFLYQAMLEPDREDLIDLAVLVDRADPSLCPSR